MSNTLQHGWDDSPRKWGYYFVKAIFKIMTTIFYSEVETIGTSKFPKQGPVIVAINHVNSLTDAAITLCCCPRDVRLTCKDTLLTKPGFMSMLIRNTESIPFQRRADYKKNDKIKVDNTQSVNALLRELGNGCCVGLFPEGLCRYKPQLSRFRSGVARTAIDYVSNVLNGSIESKYDYIHIVPVGITYLHREMFRSDVSVRINTALKIDKAFLEKYNVQNMLNMDSDTKYMIAKDITNILYQTILQSTISSTDWRTICLSHLSRQIAFPESSSPRLGTFCAQYVDLTRKFNKIFIENKGKHKDVDASILALDKYWSLLYEFGLKDNRVLEMQQNISSVSIIARLIYRGFGALILNLLAAPGFILSLPLIAIFRYIRYKKVQKGFFNNYDEIAHTKMLATLFTVPALTAIYSLIISRKLSKFDAQMFAVSFPFLLWFTMRLSQDAAAAMRSFWSLSKMLFLSRKSRNALLENRKICQKKVLDVVNEFKVYYDVDMIDEYDIKQSQSISASKSWLKYIFRRIYYGRVKNDWNETIRLYDVPVDEFHLNQKHDQELEKSYNI